MSDRPFINLTSIAIFLTGLLLSSCGTPASTADTPAMVVTPTPAKEVVSAKPEWFDIKLTDVRTGQTFTVNDFAGKVVLIETMAEWCPNCAAEENQVKKLLDLLGGTEDLVSISMDTDLHEDATSLKNYAEDQGFNWYFAIAPLEVQRALGNLYSAEYLNPPLAPMLFIDRQGNVYSLPYGFKRAEALQKTLEPYLAR
jgi:cytochrome oxidase Cu insertion factor (SCO1/SenC/PrrC family)